MPKRLSKNAAESFEDASRMANLPSSLAAENQAQSGPGPCADDNL